MLLLRIDDIVSGTKKASGKEGSQSGAAPTATPEDWSTTDCYIGRFHDDFPKGNFENMLRDNGVQEQNIITNIETMIPRFPCS